MEIRLHQNCWSHRVPYIEQPSTRGYQKVRRLMQWNQYFLSYAYRFCREYKKQLFYQLWKFKLDTLIINHFIIKYILYGHPAQSPLSSVTFHNVIVFHVSLYVLIHFWTSTQKSNTNFNNLFYMNIKFDKLLNEIDKF